MRKSYEEPQLLVRIYTHPLGDVITTSDGNPDPETPGSGSDLGDGPDFPYLG